MAAFLVLLTPIPSSSAAPPPGPIVFVVDASNSMWGQIGNVSKISRLQRALHGAVEQLQSHPTPGLVAYGHRREADCNDVETLVEPGAGGTGNFLRALGSLVPTGKTPLALAFRHALEHAPPGATIVLVSDGIENCGQDPCATVSSAAASGREFRLHTIGFGIGERDHWELYCMANAGAGTFTLATNQSELEAAIRTLLGQTEPPAPPPPDQPRVETQGVDFDALF